MPVWRFEAFGYVSGPDRAEAWKKMQRYLDNIFVGKEFHMTVRAVALEPEEDDDIWGYLK